MALKCGILGLPNVGKSTLFNALTESASAAAENYPFCTIEPNRGCVAVPDERLDTLAQLSNSAKTIPNTLEFVDIAGLVKGASKGEGQGNAFLSHIRDVDALIHVVRCFRDENITHVSGRIDPLDDALTIETELMLADLESLKRRIVSIEKRLKHASDSTEVLTRDVMQRCIDMLDAGQTPRYLSWSEEEAIIVKNLQLLTTKPLLYVLNVAPEDLADGNVHTVAFQKQKLDETCLLVSAAIESELMGLSFQERSDFLETLGVKDSGLNRLIQAAYKLLGLITFFTTGPKETHAWTLERGKAAPQAAGRIHTDFEKGFIAADVISFENFIQAGGEARAKQLGKIRLEGKTYIVQDGDVIHFRFNV
jgi:GTP-binding protein YchF